MKIKYKLTIKAGPGGENSENVYRYVNSPVPKELKSVDDPVYSLLTRSSLELATKIVKKINKNIELKLSIEKR